MAALEYKKLLISSLSPALPAEHLEDRLFHQFKRFAEISLCFSHTPELGRVAYVNFRHPQDARGPAACPGTAAAAVRPAAQGGAGLPERRRQREQQAQ